MHLIELFAFINVAETVQSMDGGSLTPDDLLIKHCAYLALVMSVFCFVLFCFVCFFFFVFQARLSCLP